MTLLLLPGSPAAAAPPGGADCPETRAQLAGQHITSTDELPDLTCADLKGATLDGLDLVQVDLRGADARGTSFRHARMIQAELSGADLRDAHFEYAELGQAQLDGVDARGASFAHAGLDQADLNTADLRGADFFGATLIQTNLSEADLRGAKAYWALSIQASISGARVNVADPRTPQFALLAVVLGLVALVRSIVDMTRGRGTGGGVRKATMRAVVFLAIGGFVWLMGWMLFALAFVVTAYPLLIGAALVFLSGLVPGRRRDRTPPAAPYPQVTTINPWS